MTKSGYRKGYRKRNRKCYRKYNNEEYQKHFLLLQHEENEEYFEEREFGHVTGFKTKRKKFPFF
jgi:hypothetical protein